MKRAIMAAALVASAAAPAAAQWAGMPVWNSPKGGTGLGIYADYSSANAEMGGGYAYGARASLGLGTLTVSAGFASWEADSATENANTFGGTVAFRVMGGSLLPVAVNILGGVARTGEFGTQTFP